MTKIEVGEYVRTIWGMIRKVSVAKDTLIWCEEYYYNGKYSEGIVEFKDIKAHSKNIIDLIEVDDYVNGYKVDSIENGKLIIGDTTQVVEQILENNEDIKTIVTKEQFNSVMYKVGDIE